VGKVLHGSHAAIIFFAGIVAISILLSVRFQNKHAS
jgi:hypothetical protein